MPKQYIDKEVLKVVRDKLWTVSKAKAITLEDVQDRTGFSYSQVHRILRGTNNTSISSIIAICKALEIQPEEIFDFKIEIPKYSGTRKEMSAKKR